MLRVLSSASLALLVVGCASIPQPEPPTTHHNPPVAKQVIKPVEQPAPTFQQRWYSKFKVHPKWFH
jgi:hypothetical protein